MDLGDQFDLDQLQGVVTSLGVGLLIGLERERRPSAKAGLRTSALVALLGYLAAMLGDDSGSAWIVAAGLVATGATMIVAYGTQPDASDPGTTTVIALLVCYSLGAAVWHSTRTRSGSWWYSFPASASPAMPL